MNELTYGATPAGMYLARTLTKLDNPNVTRSVSRRITSTNRQVAELINSYENDGISSKTLGNCLRLMRREVIDSQYPMEYSDERLIEELTRNVQIGCIKQGIRLGTIARKSERVMVNPKTRSSKIVPWGKSGSFNDVFFRDSETNTEYLAGALYEDGSTDTYTITRVDIDDVTSAQLHARSDARCRRMGKEHMRNRDV